MINFIVSSSLFVAIGFSLLWFFSKDLRGKIEAPKYDFQNKIRAFEKQNSINSVEKSGTRHEG